MPLRVSCLGPVLRLFSSVGDGPAPSSPCLAGGRAPPCGQACFCELALLAVGAAPARPGGGPLAWVWGAWGWALPHTQMSGLGACSRGQLPTGCRCGGCGCGPGDPSPTPQRALLRAGFARCAGGTRVPGGGRLLPGCGASGVGRSPTPDRPSLGCAAGAHYPLAVRAGGVGRGTPHLSHSKRPYELALHHVRRHEGARERAPLAWVLGVGSWALSHARLPVLGACSRGPLRTGYGCGGDAGAGTRHQPHSAWSRERALRAIGAARECPEEGASCLGVGRPGLGAPPRPTARPWGVRPGSATHCLWVRGVWAWGPVTNPTVCALASWPCALWGRHEGARRGRLVAAFGGPGVGGSPTPDCPSLGRAAVARYPLAAGAGSLGLETRHQPQSARSCEPALRVVGGARGRLAGAPIAGVCGVLGLALSHSRPPVLWVCGRGPLPTGCGGGGLAHGDLPRTA